MSEKSVNFDDKKILKSEFYKNKKVTSIDDVNVNKILVSKKEPYGTKNSRLAFQVTTKRNIARADYSNKRFFEL